MTKSPFIGGLGVVFERYGTHPPGRVTIRLPFRKTHNDGTYFHAGVIVGDGHAGDRGGLATTTSTRACAPPPCDEHPVTPAPPNAATGVSWPAPRGPQGTHVHRDHRYRADGNVVAHAVQTYGSSDSRRRRPRRP